jgi:hypothetical protein
MGLWCSPQTDDKSSAWKDWCDYHEFYPHDYRSLFQVTIKDAKIYEINNCQDYVKAGSWPELAQEYDGVFLKYHTDFEDRMKDEKYGTLVSFLDVNCLVLWNLERCDIRFHSEFIRPITGD